MAGPLRALTLPIAGAVMTLLLGDVALARDTTPRSFWARTGRPLRLGLAATAGLRNQNDPRWVELQFPGRPNPEPHAQRYVENITRSVNRVFVPFLRRERITYAAFTRALRAQHVIAVRGASGDEIYGGYFAGQDWKASTEALVSMARRAGEPVDAELELALEKRRLSQSAGHFRTSPVTLELGELVDGETLSSPEGRRSIPAVVTVAGVPPRARPSNEVTESAALHRYPDPRHLPLYLASMYRSLESLSACDGCSRKTRLELLAEYFHTASNAHLFERVNHSLVMSQVNATLLAMGTPGLKHALAGEGGARLDALAITMHVEDFKRVFLAEVEREPR